MLAPMAKHTREPTDPVADVCSEEGAARLAARLEAYWHEHGHPEVRFWSERIAFSRRRAHNSACDDVWAVRSNLVRGLPPRT